MYKRFVWFPSSIISLLLISTNAAANPVMPHPYKFAFFLFFILIIINLPINFVLYDFLMWCSLVNFEKYRFSNPSKLFMATIFSAVFFCTSIGAIIDVIVFFFIRSLHAIILGLAFIFISFYFVARSFQKLPFETGMIIAGGITIINGLFWYLVIAGPEYIDIWIVAQYAYILMATSLIAFHIWYDNRWKTDERNKTTQDEENPYVINGKEIGISYAGIVFIMLIFVIVPVVFN